MDEEHSSLEMLLSSVIKNYIEPARVITITSGKGGVGKSIPLSIWQSGSTDSERE